MQNVSKRERTRPNKREVYKTRNDKTTRQRIAQHEKIKAKQETATQSLKACDKKKTKPKENERDNTRKNEKERGQKVRNETNQKRRTQTEKERGGTKKNGKKRQKAGHEKKY